MSDSQFEDLGASTIMNGKLILEVRKKEQTITGLNNKVCVLQRQLMAMQTYQLASQSQLQKKNLLLKQLAADNIRLTKRLTNQEEQIIKLRQELLATDRSIHETLSSNLIEKQSLLKLNQELSQGLVKAQQILHEKLQELKIFRLKMSEKDKFAENLEIKIKEFETEKSHLQNLIKSFQQSQQMHLKAVSDMQQKLNSEKQYSESLTKEINELNQTIMELQQNHLQTTEKLTQQLSLEQQAAVEVRKEKDSLIAELIDLKQKGTEIQKGKQEEKEQLRVIIEKQKSQVSELENKVKSLTHEINSLSAKEVKSKKSQPQVAKASQITIKQWQIKCKKLHSQLDQLSQVLNYSYQQCEALRGELKEIRNNHGKLTQECTLLKEDKNKIEKQLQNIKLENNQLHLTNHQLAVLIQQSSEEFAIARKQLSIQHEMYSKKTIEDLNDQSSHEFVLLKIEEIVHNIETQINACKLESSQKAHAIYKQKQVLLRMIKSIFEQGEEQKMIPSQMRMNKDGNKRQQIKKKPKQSKQKVQKFFNSFDPLFN